MGLGVAPGFDGLLDGSSEPILPKSAAQALFKPCTNSTEKA